MKRTFPLLILAIVTFSLVWLFLQRDRDANDQVSLDDDERTFRSSGAEPFELRARDPKGHKGVEAKTVKIEKDDEVAPGEGRIFVSARLPGGTTPQELVVVCSPALPVFSVENGGWALDEVPAGRYSVSVLGGSIIPSALSSVVIEAGNETRLKFKVIRGIRPKGIVRDASDNTPIANVMVDFNAFASVKTDSAGRFAIEDLLPRTALDVITVGNEMYGTIPFRGLVVEDVGNMKLFLGGGKGVVHIEIVNATQKTIPKDAFLQVTLPPTFEIRRQIPLRGREILKLEKMYNGTFRFELHFPRGEFPTQRIVHQVPMWQADKAPVTQLRFVLRMGATLTGKFHGPTSFTSGMKLQLRDRRNHLVAETTVDKEGNYLLENLKAGEYVPVVIAGKKPHQLPLITIEPDRVTKRDVDPLRKKWLN
jgi:hypothetical protein